LCCLFKNGKIHKYKKLEIYQDYFCKNLDNKAELIKVKINSEYQLKLANAFGKRRHERGRVLFLGSTGSGHDVCTTPN
jgi:hypothetical protein